MTDQHRATPDQWTRCTSDALVWGGAFSCILELRSRIEALELAFRAQTGSLTPAEQAELGVVHVSDVKAAVELSVNHAVHNLESPFGAASSSIVFKHIFTASDIVMDTFYFDPNGINVHLGILHRFEVEPGDYVKVAHLPGVEPCVSREQLELAMAETRKAATRDGANPGVCSMIDYRVLSVAKGVECLYITVVPLSFVVHDSRCLSSAFDALCAYARNYCKEHDGDTVEIDEQIEVVKAAMASRPMPTSFHACCNELTVAEAIELGILEDFEP